MRTILIKGVLTYDDDAMHEATQESYKWFMEILLREKHLLHNNDCIGDSLGEFRVISVEPREHYLTESE